MSKNHMLIYIRVTNHGAARDHNRSEKQRKSPNHLEVIHPMLLIHGCVPKSHVAVSQHLKHKTLVAEQIG